MKVCMTALGIFLLLTLYLRLETARASAADGAIAQAGSFQLQAGAVPSSGLAGRDQPVSMSSGGAAPVAYDSMTAAINGAPNDVPNFAVIQGWAYTFLEDITLNRSGNLVLKGGYDRTYATRIGSSCLKGALNIAQGSLTVDRLTIGCGANHAGTDLSSLTLSSGTLRPGFTSAAIDYATSIADVQAPFFITASTTNPGATLTINGVAATSGQMFRVLVFKEGDVIPVVVRTPEGAQKTYSLHLLPKDFPSITVSSWPSAQYPSPGRLFLCNMGLDSIDITGSLPSLNSRPYLMILANNGVPITYKKVELPYIVGTDFKVLQDDRLHAYLTPPSMDQGVHLMLTGDLTEVATRTIKNYPQTDAHDIILKPDGNVLMFSYNERVTDLSDVGGAPNAIVLDLIIQEQDSNGAVAWEWSSNREGRLDPRDATEDIDLTVAPPAKIDYVHGNAMMIDTDGNLIVSCRHQDQIIKIRYENGTGNGDIIWRIGGLGSRKNDFTWYGNYEKFSHQHFVRRLANGNLLFFDNGNLRYLLNLPKESDWKFSRAVEYKLDELRRTIKLVWEYKNADATSSSGWTWSPCMGSVQRISGGNTLIGWGGTNPAVVEVATDPATQQTKKILQIDLPGGEYSYRAMKFLAW